MIAPVILCGGSGTRLWPLSRKSYPKQFSHLVGDETLFQASVRRMQSTDLGLKFARPLILTGSTFRFIVTEQLSEIGVDPGAILIEPEGRNTAPAILAAALYLYQNDPDTVMLVAPSDHVLPDAEAFHAAISQGLGAVEQGKIVTFGIQPDRAETGYGYLELEGNPDGIGTPIPLLRFVEKPDQENAQAMLDAGNFLWNAGIFLFKAADIIAAFKSYAADLMVPVNAAVANAKEDLGFLRLAPGDWANVEDIPIDYAVMERARNLAVVPFRGRWSDLGGWDAVWRENAPDEQGVVTSGAATAIECRNSLLRSDSDRLEVVGVGLENYWLWQ